MNTINFLTILLLVKFSCALRLKDNIFNWQKGDPTLNIEVDAGSTFSIRLAGNGSTGYIWTLENFDTLKNQNIIASNGIDKEGRVRYISSNPNLMGSSGYFNFSFTSVDQGTISLSFIYARSWISSPYDITTTVNITVK
jgi:predicted secreted protein